MRKRTQELVNVGLIGTGVTIRTHLPAFRGNPLFHIRGICGSTYERAKLIANQNGIPLAYPDARSLCDDPDIQFVVVASPNEFHEQHFTAAVTAGKDVLVEKPLVADTNTAVRLSKSTLEANQLVLVNHQLRFLPAFRYISDCIRTGLLGRIFRVRIFQQGNAFVDPATPWFWSFDSAAGGGIRWAMGSHLVDLWRFFQPSESLYRVTGSLDAVITTRHGRKCDSSSCMVANILTQSGCTVEIVASAFGFGKPDFEVSICGMDGEIRFDLESGLRISALKTKGSWVTVPEFANTPAEAANAGSLFRASSVYFVSELASAYQTDSQDDLIKIGSTLSDVQPNHIILDAILQSAKTGHEQILGIFPGCNSET